MRFEEQTQVKQRLAEGFLRAQQQGHQEASNPAVAVEEWMDRLKRNVRQRCLEERGRLFRFIVNELLLPIEARHDFLWWRRHKPGET